MPGLSSAVFSLSYLSFDRQIGVETSLDAARTSACATLTQIRGRAQEFHRNHERAAAADHGEFYDIADTLLRDHAYQRVFARNGLIVNRYDQIATDPQLDIADCDNLRCAAHARGFFGRTSGHLLHQQAARARQAERFGQIASYILGSDADFRPFCDTTSLIIG